MESVLGLVGLAVFVACVVSLAASVTWVVVKADGAVRRARQRPAATTTDA